MGIEETVRTTILDVFRRFNVGAGEYLPVQSVMGNIMDLEPPQRECAEGVIESMILDDLLEERVSPPGYILTPKGAACVYGN